MQLNLLPGGHVDLEEFLGDDSGAVERVVEPEVGGQGALLGDSDDAVFEDVGGFEAEDTDGFDAHILVGGGVDDRGMGMVDDGAGQDVGGAAAGMDDVNERNIHGFERAVVVEVEAGELANA